ncbi:uncharacterized protein LOC142357614 [Convolutriloba macropyga]|uniref:uncharacterized protein LOC142357614 n=1 Tax=Convolutriloba macropyga TaxID=536237 RepID=UPI003F51AD2A
MADSCTSEKRKKKKNRKLASSDLHGQLVLTVLFFMALVSALVMSVVVTLHSFVTSEETITEKVKNVEEHERSGIVFFGVGFYMELCRVIYLQPGSLDVSVMFHNGSSCVSRQVDITLDWGDFAYLKENKMAGDTDFSAYINFYVQNTELKNRGDTATLSLIAIRGPSSWKEKETVYVKMRSQKSEFMHPMYLLSQFPNAQQNLDTMNNQASQGLGLEALNMFAGLISTQKASFRLVSSATTTMFSMSDGTLRHESTQTTIRNVKTEPTYICGFASNGGMADCRDHPNTDPSTLHQAPLKCPSDEERNLTTYSESLFRWADGHVSEKVSSRKQSLWDLIGALGMSLASFSLT